jgi:hypothetical protein
MADVGAQVMSSQTHGSRLLRIHDVRADGSSVRCTTDGEDIEVPRVPASYLRSGDDVRVGAPSSPIGEYLATQNALRREARQLYFGRLGCVTRPAEVFAASRVCTRANRKRHRAANGPRFRPDAQLLPRAIMGNASGNGILAVIVSRNVALDVATVQRVTLFPSIPCGTTLSRAIMGPVGSGHMTEIGASRSLCAPLRHAKAHFSFLEAPSRGALALA